MEETTTHTAPAVDLRAERARCERLVALALEAARAGGADAAEASASVDRGLSVTVRLGEVETIEFHRDQGIGIAVYVGRRKASASTADLREASVRAAVEAALAIARHTGEDACAGLADPDRLARDWPELDLHHPWGLDAEGAIALARACEDAARAVDRRIENSEGATVTTHDGTTVYGNTHGFLGGYETSRHSVSCAVVAREGEAMERDYWWTVARDPAELEPAEAVGRRAGERAARRLGGRKLATRECPVAFAAEVATGLIGHFLGAIRGGRLYRRASFLLDRLGEAVFPAWMAIREDPHIPKALGSAPFDAEGVATRARDLVSDGVLRGYVLDTYSACRLGMETTGNAGGVHNVLVAPSLEGGLESLLAEMGEGLLVTELMGHGVNYVTGDYSRGAAGYWVEGGRIAYPVHEITIAGNLARMFRDIVAVADDVDRRGRVRTGAILVGRMTVAGD